MSRLIESIKSRSAKIRENRTTFLAKLLKLESAICDSLGGVDVSGQSVSQSLKMIGPDDWIYGHLNYTNGAITVAHRSTEDDFQDSMSQIPPEFHLFEVKGLTACPIEWLERLSSERQINSLLSSIDKNLTGVEESSTGAAASVEKILWSQSNEISSDTEDLLKEIGADQLLRSWIKARNTIQSDPSDSITRSSSYLESICRHVLTEMNEPLPNRKEISSLIGSVVNVLGLSENTEANNDLTQLFGGVKSIFQAVGTMRTHFGTAHGFTPGDYVAQEHYARLVNDAAAMVSTYVIRRYQEKPKK